MKAWFLTAALVAAVILAYQPACGAGFIWDDGDYVTNNQTLHDLDGLRRIWFDWHANPQYYPLVHTSFWVEYHLWRLNPLGYHVVNILLHAANALLLWLLLRRLAVPGAFWAAALFAVHPVEVESVAWITERKNVLSTLCYLGSFLAFLRFWPPEERSPQPAGRWRYYAWTLLLFAAALFSKTVACSLPAAFLLVRWWKQGRLSARDVLATAPLFVLSLSLGLLTAHLEKEQVGAHGADWDFTPAQRLLIAGRAVWFYAGKLVWPTDLTFIYPRWEINAGAWPQYLFPATALVVVVTLWLLRNRIGRGPLAAVLFFGGTLVPALGFFDVYPMRYSFVADHFQYLAAAGLFVLFAASTDQLRRRFAAEQSRAIGAAWCLLLAVLAGLTWQQTLIYRDALTLWNDTLAKNPSCWLAWNNRGLICKDDEAIAHYRKALDLKPDYDVAHYNLGNALAGRGQDDEAIAHYRRALEIEPAYADAHNNLGNALAGRRQFDEAIVHYRKALELKPDIMEAHHSLGLVLAGRGEVDEAIVHYRKALELNPGFAVAHYNLGNALAGRGEVDAAIVHYRKALELKPDIMEAHYNLGAALAGRGQVDAAIAHYRQALDLASARENWAVANLISAQITRLRQ